VDDPIFRYLGEPGAYGEYDAYDDDVRRLSKPNRTKQIDVRKHQNRRRAKQETRKERVESRDGTFRCRHCKTLVGVPISGGKHRNHCPLCLYSRHVDARRPGDRQSTCRSMMKPIGLFTRRSGEQVLVHECLGCGVMRHNRVAADDNVVEAMRLPVITVESERIARKQDERSVS
jgi:hypothetical protein